MLPKTTSLARQKNKCSTFLCGGQYQWLAAKSDVKRSSPQKEERNFQTLCEIIQYHFFHIKRENDEPSGNWGEWNLRPPLYHSNQFGISPWRNIFSVGEIHQIRNSCTTGHAAFVNFSIWRSLVSCLSCIEGDFSHLNVAGWNLLAKVSVRLHLIRDKKID